MEEIAGLEKLISIRIMQEDAESIYSLLQTERDAIFSIGIIPYYALFVQSCQEYVGEVFLPEPISKDIKDIRNYIKIYSRGFEKSKGRVANADDMQDKDFREQLKFDFLKKFNIHFNLGTYWTDSGEIIGNTQQFADYLSIDRITNPKNSERCFQIGCEIGSFVASFREGLMGQLSTPAVERRIISTSINYYCDINTNKNKKLFSPECSKEMNLFFLHLLCNMNFVKFVLKPLFAENNTWMFRVEYIVSYYTLRALERFKNHCDNNKNICVETKEISDILKQGEKIFNSKLRNCMMHYSLENAGVISLENVNKPFYGIIETCFEGISYQDYLIILHDFSDTIIGFLNKQFDFSDIELENLKDGKE